MNDPVAIYNHFCILYESRAPYMFTVFFVRGQCTDDQNFCMSYSEKSPLVIWLGRENVGRGGGFCRANIYALLLCNHIVNER